MDEKRHFCEHRSGSRSLRRFMKLTGLYIVPEAVRVLTWMFTLLYTYVSVCDKCVVNA